MKISTKYLLLILLNILLTVMVSQSLMASQKRIALVIGNANYQNNNPLVNTLNDARDMKLKLEQLNFEVLYAENSTRKSILPKAGTLR